MDEHQPRHQNGKNSINAVIRDVGMLIGPWALKSLNSIEKIQPGIIIATFNSNPSSTIISCNNPNNASDESDIDAFYKELSFLFRNIPK